MMFMGLLYVVAVRAYRRFRNKKWEHVCSHYRRPPTR